MFERVKEMLGLRQIPISPQVVEALGKSFEFVRVWQCGCGAKLKIRAREARKDGPSNLTVYPEWHKLGGHSIVPSGMLTWNGLAEERGWQTDPVLCPACQAGMTVAEYKAARRAG